MNLPADPEKIAENAWLKLGGRLFMWVAGAISLPMTIAAISWAGAVDDNMALLRERVVVLENSTRAGREDRIAFQNETRDMLQRLLALQAATNERLSRVEAQIDAAQRSLDRR